MMKNSGYGSSEKTARTKLQSGMVLDCARRYYSVNTIKRLIDVLSENEGSFLQLHLTDNENVGIECILLGQIVDYAERLSDGSYRHPYLGRRYLSRAQIREIIDYAHERHVEIIPEIEAPAHMEGFFALADYEYGNDHVNSLAYARWDYPGELNISSEFAVQFVKRIYDEYADLFHDCPHFHIGCDEMFSCSSYEKLSYINNIAIYMRNKGFIVRMWSDLITKENINDIDKRIQINYWSWDGDARDENVRMERRAQRASVPELQAAGFELIICNSYYLYYIPSLKNFNTHDNNYMIDDIIKNWTIKVWDSNHGTPLQTTNNIIGSAVAMWSECSTDLSEEQIITQFIRQYRAMAWVNQQ